jgi:large subunit ribosomal protein L31
MKSIHPPRHNAIIRCTCGAEFRVGSTKKEMQIEICSHCHPFYTGSSKIVDSSGRVERFRERLAKKKIKITKPPAK